MGNFVNKRSVLRQSLKQGLKEWGDRGKKAANDEMQQLHDMKTFTPVHAHELTKEQKRRALSSLIFLKEKSCGKIKGRSCADGRPQRETMTKEETTSPTVMNENVFITATIDAHEGRDVATVDVPGAFLHTDVDPNDETVHMVLRGVLAELMVKVDPKLYTKYVIHDKKGRMVLYVTMQKALYGMLKSALLFYKKLVGDLERADFKLNPYDPCVANKMVNER